MTTYLEKLPDCRAQLRVELDAEAVRSQRKKIVSTFASKARIPGFRPGKVPSEVIEKRFRKAIDDELRDRLVQVGCREGIAKEGLDVVHVSEVDDIELHDDDTFTFTVRLQTAPEVQLPDYRGIQVSVPRVEVTEFDIDHEVEHIRMQLARYDPVEGRALQMGDYAVIDFKTEIDGLPVGEVVPAVANLGLVEGHVMPMREDSFISGFCGHLVDQSPKEIRSFDLPVPDDFPVEELRGRTLHFTVTLLELKEKVVPELTDEEVKRVSGLDGGVVELRDRLRQRMQQQQEAERHQEMTTQILEYLDSQTAFELPEAALTQETQRQVNQIVRRSQMQGLSDGEVMEHKDSIIRHAATQAEVNVKTGFILRQIAEKEKIEATEREILVYCAGQAKAAGVSLKKYVNQLRKADMVGDVAESIVRIKTLELLREHATVTETDRPAHECDHPEHQKPAPEVSED